MEIPAAARKCPYCLHWQRWLSLQNPTILVPSLLVPLLVFYGITEPQPEPCVLTFSLTARRDYTN